MFDGKRTEAVKAVPTVPSPTPSPSAEKPANAAMEKPVLLSAYDMFASGKTRQRNVGLLLAFDGGLGFIALIILWTHEAGLMWKVLGTIVILALCVSEFPIVRRLVTEEAGMARVVQGKDFNSGDYYWAVLQAPKLFGRIWALLATAGVDEPRMIFVKTTDDKLHEYFIKANPKYGGTHDFQKVEQSDYEEADKKARANAGKRPPKETTAVSAFRLWREPIQGRPDIPRPEPKGTEAS